MRPNADIYDLIWRVCKSALIHEYTFRLWRDENVRTFEAIATNSVHYFAPESNRYLIRGIPLPVAGSRIEMVGEDSVCRIFMDLMSLCPECGRLGLVGHAAPPAWGRRPQIDEIKMWEDVEAHLDTPEFHFQVCDDKQLCLSTIRMLTFSFQRCVIDPLPPAKDERLARQQIYAISGQQYIKIGIAENVDSRLSTLRTSSPFPLTLLKSWQSANAKSVERRLHEKFAKFRHSGEWFILPPDILDAFLKTEDLEIYLHSDIKDSHRSAQ